MHILYTHPGFRDVRMEVAKRFYIKEKNEWSLKIRWHHKKGGLLSGYYRIKISDKLWKEFKRVYIDE